jgi:glutamate-5-semialdehyde dehydrogenase
MKPRELIVELAKKAKVAAAALTALQPHVKNKALLAMADALQDNQAELQKVNEQDLEIGKAQAKSPAFLDRLLLNEKRIRAMADSIRQVAALDDPVGEIYEMRTRPNGLRVGRMRVPIGVIGFIYESRPNVTSDAASLCVKSGNAVILRGGSEAIHSNRKIAEVISDAGIREGLPAGAIQLIPVTEREVVNEMLKLNEYIDLIIPRGGRALIETVVNNSTIPVIKHYDGNCYIYVDASADVEMAKRIILNAKTQRPGVCNAVESLLIHQDIADTLLPVLIPALESAGVEIRACEQVRARFPHLKPATQEDWLTEYLALILSVKIIESTEAAIEFINTYGSHHTDAIITQDHDSAMAFLSRVDSACVFVNASTRFSDGGEFGMGCEVGISTDKLHARGPMGLKELTTSKFIVFGSGQIRE